MMDSDYAAVVLRREAKRAAIEEAERATAAREAEEAAWASERAAAWRAEYQTLLSKRPGLRATIEATDLELVKAIDELQAAHAAALALFQRRTEAENQATRLNSRLSRLASWIADGRAWTEDVVSVPALPKAISWRIQAWTARPWPL